MSPLELDDLLDEIIEPVCDLCEYTEFVEQANDWPVEIAQLFEAAHKVKERYGFDVQRGR